ncbi:MAG TPA: 4Fe-4S binding protein [Methanocorpusculum sp.]|nr:4Fe-4S binding protein [Methanocorpusculum sp.]
MPAVIDEEKCIGCQTCVDVCPSAAISMKDNEKAFVNPDECVDCETCVDECPESAIHME